MEKTLLLYGDSNTWGCDPSGAGRFDRHTRWAGVVRDRLAPDWWVVEEGLNGRTTVHDDVLEPGRSGMAYLPSCLDTHAPIDVVLVMLGTNDLKKRFDLPPSDIARGARLLGETVLRSDVGPNGKAPALILMCPPPTAPVAGTRFEEMFAGADEKSQRLADHYRVAAKELGCMFINAGAIITSSPIDAIHFEADQHQKLGEFVAQYLREHFA